MKLRLLRSSENTELGGRPLAIVDTCVQVSALVASDEHSANVRVVEAALSGLYVCVLSAPIRTEVIDVFSRPKLGMLTPELVEGHLEALWRTAEWVDLAESDSAYSRAVIDADDEILLRTAGGVMVRPDLAALDPRYIVTNNARHVRGRNFFGFRVRTAAEFWDELSDARERHLALVQDAEAGDAG